MRPQAPCKDCPDRDAINNCHGRCEKYKAFKDECLVYNKQVAKIKASNVYFDERACNNVGRFKHKNK